MSKSKFIHFIFSALIMLAQSAFSQQDSITAAYDAMQRGDLNRAQIAIEAASLNPATAGEYQAWSLKAYIYKELSKKYQGETAVEFRFKSLESVKTSIQLDKKKENYPQDSAIIDHLSRKFFNDAVILINKDASGNTFNISQYIKSIRYFQTYEECIKLINPNVILLTKEVEFKLALASRCTETYESDRKENEALFMKSVELYSHILKIEPDNIKANYAIGVLYYNKAVAIINEMDFETDLIALSETQDKTIEIFKQSLPFMEKAYLLNPKRKDTLIGLEGIYYSLNENEKLNKIKEELNSLDK